jgi:hypothetical protein
MTPEGGGYFIINQSDSLPTGVYVFVLDYQYISEFTVAPGSDTLTTTIPHTQIDREVVMVLSNGTLPGGLHAEKIYRVWNSTANTMQLIDNDVWPTISIVDITDAGVGTHTLWIRVFELAGTIQSVDTVNDIITLQQQHHLRANNRIQFAVTGGSLPPPLAPNTDYRVVLTSTMTDFQFRPVVADLTGPGSGTRTVWSPGYQSSQVLLQYEWGAHGLETAYLLGGGFVTLIGGGGGGAAEGGGEPLMVQIPRPTIKVRDPELASILRRARRASRIIEDLQIVGASGDSSSGFALND